MDRGKRPIDKVFGIGSNKIYMDLREIIRENTLQYLPAKSLFRCQSVCRDWKLQISTPFFAHSQSVSCRAISGFFYQEHGKPPSLIPSDPMACGVPDPTLGFLPESVDIRSSSNGLLCCQGRAGERTYYICNPVTQEWKEIPKPNADHGCHPAIVLVFEPSLLNFVAEYKLICAFASHDFDDATEFEIYSSKEGSWKISGEISFADLRLDPKTGVYANGIVFWKGKFILAYDLTKERSMVLYNYGTYGGILGTLNGKLCSASVIGRWLSLSVMGDIQVSSTQINYSDLWKESERILIEKDLISGIGADRAFVAMSESLVLFNNGEKLYSFDLKNKILSNTTEVDNCRNVVYLPYVNSFASL